MAADLGYAQKIRELLAEKGVLMVNLIGSPGSGKTMLLERTLTGLDLKCAVIEGDVATDRDAQRIRATGTPSVQINTNGGCHLEANWVADTLEQLPLDELDLIFVENVGNLVCPAEFDIGEDCKVAVSSLPEGSDKPLKYPLIFTVCDALIINKIDVLPYFDFDMEKVVEYAHMRNPKLKIFPLSAKTGEGVDAWCNWLREQVRAWNG